LTRINLESGQCRQNEIDVTWPADFPSSANLPSITTDRAFGGGFGALHNEAVLIDTNDGSILKNYGDRIVASSILISCDGKRALIKKIGDGLLVDTSDGRVIATYENGFNRAFSCSRLEVLNKGLDVVMNRAAVGPGPKETCCAVKLIDTDTGAVIGEYSGTTGTFNCKGDLLKVDDGEMPVIVNAVTGEVILSNEKSTFLFSC